MAMNLDADDAIVEGDDPPSARVPLSTDRIVTAAVDFVDEWVCPA